MQIKKKLLFILPTLNIGGAEKVTINIINKLDKKLFDITLVVIDSRYKNLESYVSKDIRLKYLNIAKTRNAFFALFKEIRIVKPDIVYSSLNRTNLLILMLNIIYPFFKVIVREPSTPLLSLKSGYMSKKVLFMIKLLYPRATKIIAQTKYMKEEIENIYNIQKDKVVAISNPLDKESIKNSLSNQISPFSKDEDMCNFVYVGRLSDEKNPMFLVEVFKKVIKQDSKFHLHIVGDGHLKDEIQEEIIKNDLDKNIHLLEFQSNPYPFIKYADGLVLSSRWEGMPNVVIEALYLKTIIISTNSTPVLRDIIKDGENGFVADGFNVDEFTKCVLAYKDLSNEFNNRDEDDFDALFMEVL